MKVLIAEDELLERKAMRKFLEDNFQDLAVVGEAVNGRKAIEMAAELGPDVILMDIKMPGINGLEAIEKIRADNQDIKFILVSAYDSFEYAKQAMRMGVREYILKPSKKEETIRAVLRVKKEIAEQEERRRQESQSDQLARELLLAKIMQYDTGSDTLELLQSLFPNMQSAYFLVAVGWGGNLSSIAESLREWSSDQYILQSVDGQIVIAGFSDIQQNKAAVLKLARKLQLKFGKDSFVGAGHPCRKLKDLPESFFQANSAVNQLAETGGSSYGFPPQDGSGQNSALIRKIVEETAQGNEKNALHYLYKLLEVDSNREVLVECYYRLKQELHEKGIVPPEESLSSIQTRQDWAGLLRHVCQQVQYFHQSHHKMERARKYISDHFHESISLEDVALHTDLSPNYFSNLFKEATGETFIDYLTNIRLRKAKEFLESNQYSLKEISFMIGYKDPNYFSRVFKKYYLMSPKQYQKQILK
ncbi:response regulator [Sediminibacillus massiliensis]|uniref:response regulator n=1 Tax=Sediminibacillus massiliensis TaxID=1926277 RepID=UPI00098843E1|nr:response regulator [Sediminibacillus massiliensis]